MHFSLRSWPVILAVTLSSFVFLVFIGSRADTPAAPAAGAAAKPTVAVSFSKPTRTAIVRVTFAGTPPADTRISAWMPMRGETHTHNRVTLTSTSDPHTLQAKLHFSMSGDWTIEVRYNHSQRLTVPLRVGR